MNLVSKILAHYFPFCFLCSGLRSLDARARQDVAILGLEFLKLDGEVILHRHFVSKVLFCRCRNPSFIKSCLFSNHIHIRPRAVPD